MPMTGVLTRGRPPDVETRLNRTCRPAGLLKVLDDRRGRFERQQGGADCRRHPSDHLGVRTLPLCGRLVGSGWDEAGTPINRTHSHPDRIIPARTAFAEW